MSLIDLFGGESARGRLDAAQARLRDLATAEGLEMAHRDRTYNSRLAQELGAWAEEAGRADAFHDAAFQSYFVEAEDISDRAVLLKIVKAAGLDVDEAAEVIDERTHRAAVDADWSRSRAAGVTGVPTFVINGQRVVGAQPLDVLERLVRAGRGRAPFHGPEERRATGSASTSSTEAGECRPGS